jgi:hypothetical protein
MPKILHRNEALKSTTVGPIESSMLTKTNQTDSPRIVKRHAIVLAAAMACFAISGCQDGPLYALKVANPYYSMREWKRDEAIGVTDHERRKQLTLLSETIDQLPASKQKFWAVHLEKMIANDDSPEMRRLAVRAAGRLKDPSAMSMIDTGLDDDSVKVRMEACNALGRRSGEEAARMLAATVGTETSEDVKHAALTALANHKNEIAVESLKIALSDRNPATRDLAVRSLKGATGKDYGDDPEVWIAALDGKPTKEVPTRFAERVRSIF